MTSFMDVVLGSLSLATIFFRMSLSVIIPVILESSSTSNEPMFFESISLAASLIVACEEVFIILVIMSETFMLG